MSEVSRAHHQAFARRHACRFLDRLRLDRHLVVGLERIDEMNTFAKRFTRNPAEQGEYADVAGVDARYRAEEQDYKHKSQDSQADEAK